MAPRLSGDYSKAFLVECFMADHPLIAQIDEMIEAKIDEIISTCDGDLRGALRALLLVNEHLEIEIERLHSIDTDTRDEPDKRRANSLH
jgi:hypothetical protein